MQNDPTGTSGSGRCSTYFDAIRRAEEDVSGGALGHVRAEEDAGRITTVRRQPPSASACSSATSSGARQLRAEHLGGTP